MSRPWRYGEFAASACSSGRWRRRPLNVADRGLGVRHADVDVQPADRRRDGVAEQVADPLVALLVGDLRLALERRGMCSGAEQARSCVPRLLAADRRARAAAEAALSHTSLISSTWQACSSRSTVPVTGPRRSSTADEALVWRPVTGSTRNSSSSTPTVNGVPVPNAFSGGFVRAQRCARALGCV